MAYYRKLPSGNWQATVRTPSGRIPRTNPLKTVVKEWAVRTEAEIAAGIWKDPRKRESLTLAQWQERWKESRVVEAETARADEGSWRLHLRDHLGDKLLADITKLDVELWVAKRAKVAEAQAKAAEAKDEAVTKARGRAAIRRALNYLKACLEAAADNNLIDANVARKVEPPADPEDLVDWFTREEVDKILAEMRRRKWESAAVMTELMCWLGLRWGEAAALTGADVDWLRRRVSVTHVLTQAGKDKPYPKTSASLRELPAPQWLLNHMSALLADRERDARIVVTRRGGRNLSGSNWRNHTWDVALEAAGIDHGTPHTCRHTCASWLVQDGVPLYEVKRQLGHASIQTTEVYAHLAPDRHDAVTDAWARLGEPGDARATHDGEGAGDAAL
ncbi:tyrosine-type recombinase/integrase [Promicromonospora iranensis]|uniref:Integrase n=1 Tax=Promicromonospora iranensis TaxID=1105144 RepID=A0ABU2CV87_9MICO|nr:site-specific integrase [Promicromonospora iranensis]MDR7385256.1 integrase [Promicromonospora iranensis]